jgi:PilZ domain
MASVEGLGRYFMEEAAKHRGFTRYGCTGGAEILQCGRLCGWGTVGEISRGGCYVETAHPLTVASEAQIRLTLAGTVLDIGAKVAWMTPQVGMGLYFEHLSPEEENKLAQIIEEIAGGSSARVMEPAEHPQPGNAPVRITREAAPEILAKIVKRINEKGVLTKQELIDLVKAQQ